ncbi:MAG: HIT domain-containing protein [Rhodanobacteraceae bacterium]
MSENPEARFELDPRLAADTVFVADWELSRLLLMDDVRFPWLILVPRRTDVFELDDLTREDRTVLTRESDHAMALLRQVAPCDKLNVGALGNVVRQLHVHVVARREADAAWPGPVWGCGKPQRYEETMRGALVTRLRDLPVPD